MQTTESIGQPLRDAVAALGGPTKTSNVIGVSNQSIHDWLRRGRPVQAEHVLRLYEACQAVGLEITAWDLTRGFYDRDRAPATAQSTPSSSRRRKPSRTPSDERAA